MATFKSLKLKLRSLQAHRLLLMRRPQKGFFFPSSNCVSSCLHFFQNISMLQDSPNLLKLLVTLSQIEFSILRHLIAFIFTCFLLYVYNMILKSKFIEHVTRDNSLGNKNSVFHSLSMNSF